MTDIIRHAIKDVLVTRNLKRRYEEGKSLREELTENKKRFSAGLMFKSGDVMLDSKVLKLVQENDRDTKEKEKAAITRNINKYEIMKAEALRCMSGNVEAKDMKTADLRAVVKYKICLLYTSPSPRDRG